MAISQQGGFFAVPETEHPIDGDTWFWSDDNAKVLEFLARPELWRRYPAESAEILRFVQAMCRGPFMFRRVSPPRLDEAEPSDGMVRALLLNLQRPRMGWLSPACAITMAEFRQSCSATIV